jgi:hypothetical protein
VARSRHRLTPEIVRARLTVAADRLTERGDKDLAEAVTAVLDTRGWELLKPAPMSSARRNVPLYMPASVKKRLEDAARKAGEESGKAPGTVLAEVVEEGWQKFLAGEFEPVPPVRAPRGKAPVKENLNVRPSDELRLRVEEAAKAASEELGWDVSAGKVAVSYLFDEFGITDEDQLK